MNGKFTSGQENQVGKLAKDAFVSLDLSKEAAQRLVTHPQIVVRLKALFTELVAEFPCQIHAPELIPDKWEVLEDVEPTVGLDVSQLRFMPVLKDGDPGWINGDTMRGRAVEFKGNFGLSDVPAFLAQQDTIPVDLQGKYILLPGTKLRDSGGGLYIACLGFRGGRWVLDFCYLGNDFFRYDRFACSE
ncbi:MAG: hypothetical protein WCT11_03960 [Candidatus Magasanikbacteria bacterium]